MSAMFARYVSIRNGVLLAAAAIVVGVMACASPQEAPETAAPAEDVLSALEVTSDGESTLVTLVGVHEADFEVASHSDPWAISIDLGSVPTESEMMPMAVYDGTVDQVSAASFTGDDGTTATRVEIALSVEAAHEIVSTPEGLTLRVVAMDGAMAESGEGDDIWQVERDPLADVEPIDPFGDEASLESEESQPLSAIDLPDPPEASTLTGVRVDAVEGGVVVHLQADGMIGATETFVLEDPARLVIDLPGMSSSVEQGRTSVGAPEVATVRVGGHADKVRVVMDGGDGADGFQAKSMMPAPDGMLVAVGSGDPVQGALTAAIDASQAAYAASLAPMEVEAAAMAMAGSEAPDALAAELAPLESDLADPLVDDPIWSVDVPEDDAPELAAAVDEVDEQPVAMIDPADDFEELEPAAASAPIEEIAEAQAAREAEVTVFGVEYQTDFEQGVERIAIVASGATDHDWVATDPETVMIRIPNAAMADGAEGNIAAREGGPLSMIRAFTQPEVEPSEVRIVVKRAPYLVPRVETIGSNVFVEFDIPEDSADEPALAANAAIEGAPAAPAADPTAPRMPTQAVAVAVDEGFALEDESVIAAATLPDPGAPAPPASLEPPAAIDVLQEGGLIDGKEYRGRRISLDFKDVAIEDVLRLIAEVSDLNIISGDEVSGNVSIRLVDVPWDQALDVILLTKGLGFVRVGNVLRIAPADVLAQEEEVRLQERRAKEKLEDLVVKLIPVNYGEVDQMQNLVKRLLTPRGTVNMDERTSTLIVKDIASVIDEATALVAAVDTETPQVMIEAKIVEANLDFARELGSVWSVNQQQLTDGFDPNSAVRRDLGGEDFRFSPSAFRPLNESNNVSFINNLTAQPTALFNLSAFLLDEKFNIDVQLQAAENTGNGKVVSSPRVVTLDNSEATVEQGVSIPFQTFENGDARLEFVDATLSLNVTPHITADQSIIMEIEVTRDAPDSTVQTATGSPAIAKNQAQTETLVKNGQTLVLGGIYTIEKTFRQSRVPYLHRIPIFGAAFKSKEVSDARKELLIFVTPRIVLQPTAES